MVADDEGWFDGYTESLRLPVPILDDLVLYAGMDNIIDCKGGYY